MNETNTLTLDDLKNQYDSGEISMEMLDKLQAKQQEMADEEKAKLDALAHFISSLKHDKSIGMILDALKDGVLDIVMQYNPSAKECKYLNTELATKTDEINAFLVQNLLARRERTRQQSDARRERRHKQKAKAEANISTDQPVDHIMPQLIPVADVGADMQGSQGMQSTAGRGISAYVPATRSTNEPGIQPMRRY